jgi:hypothetical protein
MTFVNVCRIVAVAYQIAIAVLVVFSAAASLGLYQIVEAGPTTADVV